MVKWLTGGALWAWMSDNWSVIPAAVLVLALAWVMWVEFGRIVEAERDRGEDFDD